MKIQSANFHRGIVELHPFAANMKDKALAEEKMLVTKTRGYSAEIDQVSVFTWYLSKYEFE